jgi:acyl transferase domain-containing protein/acyl carrier protein
VPDDGGRMLAIGVAPAEAEALARRFDVDVAAVNGPAAAVVAGPADALVRMREELAQQGRFARWLAVGYAFHSRAMHAAADRMAAAAAAAGTGRAGTVPLLSTVTGGQLDGTALDAAHWGANVRETVRFAGAVGAALDAGVDAFVELGPQAALATPLAQTAAERDVDAAVVHALERGRDDRVALLAALAQLYERGCELRWARLLGSAGRVVSLPRPQWEQRSHWLPRAEPEPPAHAGHWLLGARLELADAGELSVWEGSLDVRALPFLRDHRVGGDVVLPAAGFAELALAAVREGDGAAPVALRDMRFERPLRLGDAPARIQVTLRGGDGDGGSVAVHAAGATASWTAHARARAETCAAPARIELAAARARCDEPVAVDELYAALAARGLDYGPAFRALRAVRRGRLEAVARVEVDGSGGESFVCDPRVLDAAFHAVLAAIGDVAPDGLPVPVAIDELVHAHAPARAADVHVELDPAAPEGVVRADVRICDEDGSVAVAVHGLTLTALMAARPSAGALAEPVAAARPAEPDGPVRLYETEWRERPRERARDARGRWVLFDDGEGLGGRLSRALERAGGETLRVVPGPLFEQRAPGVVALDPARRQDLERLVDAAAAGDGPPLRGFVHLWGAGSWAACHAGVAAAEEHCAALMELVRALSLAPALADAELTLVTRGCHAIEPGDRAPGALAAALWGLLKVLPFEVPVLTYRCVDVDPADVEVDALLHELLAEGDEVEIAHRRGRRLVRRLARAAPACPRRQGPAPPVTAGGAYLVTGGFGGLGLAVASWLAERGAGTVALMGREGPRPGAAEALARLRSAGVELLELRGDVRSSGDVDAAFERLARAPGRLGGVVHAAGVLDDGPLLGLTRASLATVLGPKLAGAWNVAAAARRHGVDWLAFFSSAAAVLGSPGQASYCAANAFLDGFAASLRAEGFRALSVGWGPWAEAGMAADADLALSTTVNAIAPADGVRTLERLLADGRVHALALGFDLRHIIQFYPSGRGLSLLDEVTDETTALLRNAGRRAEPAERPALTREYVAPRTPLEERVAAIWQSALGMSPIGVYDGFFELGGDSVFANQIIFEIGSALGVRIDPVSAFEDFTIARLAELAEASMVERLEQMSDEEAVRLIEGEG